MGCLGLFSGGVGGAAGTHLLYASLNEVMLRAKPGGGRSCAATTRPVNIASVPSTRRLLPR